MARPALHKIFIVQLSDKRLAYVRATDISEAFNEHFTHFIDAKNLVVHSLRTDYILSITSKRLTTDEIKEIFPRGAIYVELPGIKTSSGTTMAVILECKLHR